tara:strand:+ start:1000 stop:1287 length:288 start_codon:yes stop_codon:yes gene_type:complete
MIKAVGNIRLDLSSEEYELYNKIIEIVDKTEFNSAFSTNNNGIIQCVFPPLNKDISMLVIYFLLNVMLNQRLRAVDSFIDEFKIMKEDIKKLKGE